jgi:uridine kinase
VPPRVVGVADAVEIIAGRAAALRSGPKGRPTALLVAVSGIDASGKGAITAQIAAGFERAGLRVASIGLDPWHQPASVRFAQEDPGGTFYRSAFRFDELFERLIEPLRRNRSIVLEERLIDLATDATYEHTFRFERVDIILLEGIFLLRRDLRPRYDVSIWIDCPLEVALTRALRRNQEGKPAVELQADYERIYFPAQQIHLALDQPAAHADLVLENG